MTPDLAARKVIVGAYLYYVLDAPTLSDAEYDELSEIAAAGWSDVSPDRQWALGSPKQVRATGHHIKFSSYAVHAARCEFVRRFKRAPDRPMPMYPSHPERKDGEFRWDEERRLHYVTAGD